MAQKMEHQILGHGIPHRDSGFGSGTKEFSDLDQKQRIPDLDQEQGSRIWINGLGTKDFAREVLDESWMDLMVGIENNVSCALSESHLKLQKVFFFSSKYQIGDCSVY